MTPACSSQSFATSLSRLAALPDRLREGIRRRHRAYLRSNGFGREARAILATLDPCAIAAPEASRSAREVLAMARAAGTRLARLDVPAKEIAATFACSAQAAALLGEPAGLAAYLEVQGALMVAVTGGYASVARSESELFERMLAIERTARDHGALLRGFVEALSVHIGASQARLFEISKGDSSTDEPFSPIGEPVSASKAKLRALQQIRYLRSSSDPFFLGAGQEGGGSCWSVPVCGGAHCLWVAQFPFAGAEPILARDKWILEAARHRCEVMVERLMRERRLRERALNVIQVEELERRQLSRELHDEPAQSLAVVRLHLELVEGMVPAEVRGQLSEARAVLEKTILDVRRLISDLSPVVLPQLGVVAAIRQLVSRFRRAYKARVVLQLGKLPDINHQYGLVLYRALQECFSNISRHSRAKNINVSLTAADRVLRLQVEDDGVGFHVRERMSRPECFGLVGIRERVTLVGGHLTVHSTPVGGGASSRRQGNGTQICIELPLTDESPSQIGQGVVP